MVRPKLDILRLFNPATDFPALIAVLLGLSIAIFLNEIAIKLIGACVAILGGVALFMMFSQRLKDASFLNTPRPVSETTAFKTTVRQDTSTKRLIFDDYADSFGRDEFGNRPEGEQDSEDSEPVSSDSGADKRPAGEQSPKGQQPRGAQPKGQQPRGTQPKGQQPKKQPAPERPPMMTSDLDSVDEGFTILPKSAAPRAATPQPEPTPQERTVALDLDNIEDFSDGSSSMRILGSVKKSESAAQQRPQTGSATAADQTADKNKKQDGRPPAPAEQKKQQEKEKPAQAQAAPAQPKAAGQQAGGQKAAPTAQPLREPAAQQPAVQDDTTSSNGHKRKTLNIQLADIIEETPNTIKNEPRKEFDFLISRVLMVIRSVISARTTLFFWVNFDKRELVLESRICDKPEALHTQRKHQLGNDVVSQIALSGTPEILTEINPSAELDLLPYYQTSAATRSFIGVPVYFNNNVVGILTADTTEEDAYDSMTVSFLGHFTKLISGLIQGYTEKYDLLQSARTLEVVDTFRRLVNSRNVSKEDVCTALMESLDSLITYTHIGICIYSEETDRWYIAQMRAKTGENYTGQEVHLEQTLIGKTIISGKTGSYDYGALPAGAVRLSPVEAPLNGNVATFIPLKSPSRCYGALFAETPGSSPLTQQDMEIIEVLAEYAGSTLEHHHLDSVIHSTALTDESTGVLNSVAFLNRIQEEFYRSADLRTPFSLCLVNVDKYAALNTGSDAEFGEMIAQHIVENIEQHLRPYDIVGRVDSKIFGVGLIHRNAREAQLWAERLRNDIASSILQYHGRQFSVTVSIGVVECTVQKTFDELLSNGEQALQIASGKTNSVSLYA